MDPKKILGVEPNATREEIHRAYRDKAKKHHPDLGGDGWAFQQVQDAYQALTNPSHVSQKTETDPKSNPRNREARTSERKTAHSGQSHPHRDQGKSQAPNWAQQSSKKPAKKRRSQVTAHEHSWRNLFTGQLPLQTETTTFILINCLDIFVTYMLLAVTQGAIEANPIAAFFMERWGFVGAIAFKLTIVAVVTVIAQIVAIKKPNTARTLLLAGTVMVGCVVIYSVLLFVKHTF